MAAAPGFDGNIVILGFGTVARCVLPMLMGLAGVSADRYRVVDMEDRREGLSEAMSSGLHFERHHVTRDSLDEVLSAVLKHGDLLLNLSVAVDSIPVMDWCHRHGVLYVDTALEVWDDEIGNAEIVVAERTEYHAHQRARRQAREGWRPDGPTAVVTHGANPGLVNHFAKAAMMDLARHTGVQRPAPSGRQDWARLARDLKIRAIHISERDTQIAERPKEVDEFVNTWSIEGFVEEAIMPCEFGWGTHEKTLPAGACHHGEGPCNAIFTAGLAARTMLRSWVPEGGQIAGYALPHAESVTLSDHFTLWEEGAPIYRPTVAFAYMPCDSAMASLHEFMMRGASMPSRRRILAGEIVSGMDELGVLLLGDGPCGWWYGSQLDIHEARRLVAGSNATAVQVAAGAVSAALWACRNPACGYCEPEDLPHEEILELALPWLGPIASVPTDWTPLKHRTVLFDEPSLDLADPWQFANFLV